MKDMQTISGKARLLRRKTVQEITGLPRSSIYAAIAAGTFPKPIRLGARAVGWLESEVDAWLAKRVAEAKAAAAEPQATAETV